jgi:type IV fimbrial biogenesis protein FimT
MPPKRPCDAAPVLRTYRYRWLFRGGFTVPELLTVIAIVALLATLAAPSFQKLIATQRARVTASELNSSLSVARSEAIKRNASTWLCPKAPAPSGWKDGWQIQSSECAVLIAPSQAIENHGAVANTTTIQGPTGITYRNTGRIEGGSAATLTVTSTSGGESVIRYVCVDLSGRPLVDTSSCS